MEKRLNSNHLKLIAIIAMTVDHFTDLFYPGFPIAVLPITMHLIGLIDIHYALAAGSVHFG